MNSVAPEGPKIRVRNLHKSFGDKHVLKGLDLDVGAGESVVVIGGSGTGKSVLLKCMLGLLVPEEGSIEVDGEEVVGMSGRELDRIRHKFGMLFQNAALFDSLPVWENVAFGLIQGEGMGRSEAKMIALAKLAAVGLGSEVGELWPAELSGGMRKRVGLARAIATEPEIIFFDEPTTGLDPINADVINDLILRMQSRLKVTSIVVTHDMTSAYKVGNRIAMLYKGKIIGTGTPDEIKNTQHPIIRQFISGTAQGPMTETE